MVPTSSKFCAIPGCPTKPVFGYVGEGAHYCCKHKKDGMKNVAGNKCAKCGVKQRTHNIPGEKAMYCSTCAKSVDSRMINVKIGSRRCVVCKKVATFGKPGTTQETHCATHGKPLGFIDIKHTLCEVCGVHQASRYIVIDGVMHHYCAKDGGDLEDKNPRCVFVFPDGKRCNIHPSYDNPGAPCARFCKTHSEPGMINVKAYLCEHGVRPTFNYPGQPARFCAKCRKPNMVDVVSDVCEIGCGMRARYGLPGGKARLCFEHKTDGMVNVSNSHCSESGCHIVCPCFGYPDDCIPDEVPISERVDAKGRYCSKHRKTGMVDVLHQHCGCPRHKRAMFFDPDGDGTLYCGACKPDGASSLNPICEICDQRATHGPLFELAIHCATHAASKDDGGHDLFCEFVNRFPRCEVDDCKYRPTHSVASDNYPTHCPAHAPELAREITEGQCAKCGNPRLVNVRGIICAYCELGVSKEDKRKHHEKEERLLGVLSELSVEPTTHDKALPQLLAIGCSCRPDFYFKRDNFAIILEDDEHQHQNKLIAFNHSGVPLMLDFTEDCIHILEIAESDPYADEKKDVKGKKRAITQVSQDQAGTSASASGSPSVAVQQCRRPGYTRDRDLARMVIIQRALAVPTIFIRYNPDEYVDARGKSHVASRGSSRDKIVVDEVKRLLDKYSGESIEEIDGLYVEYLFYNGQIPGRLDAFRIDIEAHKIERCAL